MDLILKLGSRNIFHFETHQIFSYSQQARCLANSNPISADCGRDSKSSARSTDLHIEVSWFRLENTSQCQSASLISDHEFWFCGFLVFSRVLWPWSSLTFHWDLGSSATSRNAEILSRWTRICASSEVFVDVNVVQSDRISVRRRWKSLLGMKMI